MKRYILSNTVYCLELDLKTPIILDKDRFDKIWIFMYPSCNLGSVIVTVTDHYKEVDSIPLNKVLFSNIGAAMIPFKIHHKKEEFFFLLNITTKAVFFSYPKRVGELESCPNKFIYNI